ncbi:4'-phosphopantetheinyl transferase family protein [Luedemannella flava]
MGVAFARRPVGLDVERTRPRDDLDGIARLALDPAEAEILAGLPERSRPAAFTRYWARKEAVLKATGEGLRTPPAQVAVSAPDDAPRLLAHAGRPGLAAAVTLRDLDPDTGHAAALAVIGPPDGPPPTVVMRERDGAALLSA